MLLKRNGLSFNKEEYGHQETGQYLKVSTTEKIYYTYVPTPLPPEPPLQLEKLYPLLDKTNIAIGRLDGISNLLPEPELFLYFYIRKEAVLSSQIEGTNLPWRIY